jgi:hypothetical protein
MVGAAFKSNKEPFSPTGDSSINWFKQPTKALIILCGCLKNPISVDINKSFIKSHAELKF